MVTEQSVQHKEETIKEIWNILHEIPDPEVPAVSLTEIGVVRDVELKGEEIHITLTPTYMGCPATHAIRAMVEEAVVKGGFSKPVLHEQLSPAWTTNWIPKTARDKLLAYGIAPPNGTNCDGQDSPAACPLCGSKHVEQISRFGSTACKALYKCIDCKEPFEYFKCH